MESRRRRTNLQLNLAPLHSISPTNNAPLAPEYATNDDGFTPSSSYIAGKSAPSTPGILTRTASGRNLNSRSYTHLAFANTGETGLVKSKSSALLSGDAAKKGKKKSSKPKRDDEWLYRAGAAIAGETRETKGQQWLATRQSSTSLVALNDEDEETDADREALKRMSGSDTWSKSGKNSRPGSARQSRRGSQVGSRTTSRVDLTAMTPTWKSSGLGEAADYFGKGNRGFDGPDFVDGEEEDEETAANETGDEDTKSEDDEIEKLASYRGFGLGGLVDRLIGWSLFEVPDDDEDDDEAPTAAASVQRTQSVQNFPAPTEPVSRQVEPDLSSQKTAIHVAGRQQESQGWKDAAWLLSVATKVIF